MSNSLNERFDWTVGLIQEEVEALATMVGQREMFLERPFPGRATFFRKVASHREALRRRLRTLEAIEEMHFPNGVPDADDI